MNAEDWGSFFGYFDVSSHPPIIDTPFNAKIKYVCPHECN
jgi:hypothetical protein